jgi:hypothetical protein
VFGVMNPMKNTKKHGIVHVRYLFLYFIISTLFIIPKVGDILCVLSFGVWAIVSVVQCVILSDDGDNYDKVAPAIVNNKEVQKLPANLVKLANQKLEEMLNEETEE